MQAVRIESGERMASLEVVARSHAEPGTVVRSRLTPIVGDENEVYRAELDDTGAVYVRIQRPGATGFGPEVWAMDVARDGGIPIPVPLSRGPIESAHGGVRDAMVIAAATGTQPSELLPTLAGDDRRLVMHNIGVTVAQLHAIATPGVGKPDHEGGWPDVGEEAARYLERAELL